MYFSVLSAGDIISGEQEAGGVNTDEQDNEDDQAVETACQEVSFNTTNPLMEDAESVFGQVRYLTIYCQVAYLYTPVLLIFTLNIYQGVFS